MCETGNDSDLEEITEMELDIDETSVVLPGKSKKLYEKTYDTFMSWRTANNMESFSESVLLCYFQNMAKKFKASSIWTEFSKLKAMLLLNHQIDISNYPKLQAFLKDISIGYKKKKSKTFLPHEIEEFLNRAPDIIYLPTKVALIFGILGACRRQELHELKFNNVKDLNSAILVNIADSSKTKGRTFTVQGKFYGLCKSYMDLRPQNCDTPKFFIRYCNGQCISQNVGINSFGRMGKTIATFLNLPNPESYTGHCFRRTSATLSIVASDDMVYLTKHNRWRDTAEESVDSTTQDASNCRSLKESMADTDSSIENVDCSNAAESQELLVTVKTETTDASLDVDPFSDNSAHVYDSDDSCCLQDLANQMKVEVEADDASVTETDKPVKNEEPNRPFSIEIEEISTESNRSHTQLLGAILASMSRQERALDRAARAQEAQAQALDRIAAILEKGRR